MDFQVMNQFLFMFTAFFVYFSWWVEIGFVGDSLPTDNGHTKAHMGDGNGAFGKGALASLGDRNRAEVPSYSVLIKNIEAGQTR